MRDIVDNNLRVLSEIHEDIWRNELETDFSAVSTIASIEEIIKVLNSLANQVRTIVLNRNEVATMNDFDIYNDITELPENLINDIKVIKILKEFVGNQKREVILNCTKPSLEAAGFWNIIETFAQHKRALSCLLIFPQISTEVLKQCLFLSSYDRFTYHEYILIPDFEGVTDLRERARLEQVQHVGIQNPQFTVSLVNQIVNQYEREKRTRMLSNCRNILNHDNEIIIFILRESQRSGLRTIEEFVVGMNADWIVLSFSRDLRSLRVRAVNSVKPEVYETYAIKLFKLCQNLNITTLDEVMVMELM
ncbi:hypothetical protein [Heliorestis convoluta]|uniref:Uncharacterized protein n=1 Tax=Heliorestis convoluta TaxID=356322 RepID=A0A5Q2MZF1_9FIRM|nr:hypothetical protein [Heliorestis convoluta]QGG46839.1 hypothetical protein FTV88_0661 [Heliorestis convoluta]